MTEIRQLVASSAFSDLDRHFAAFIEAHAGGEQPLVALAAARESFAKSKLTLRDFANLLSPAAGELLEPMGRRSQALTRQRFGRELL